MSNAVRHRPQVKKAAIERGTEEVVLVTNMLKELRRGPPPSVMLAWPEAELTNCEQAAAQSGIVQESERP